MHRCPMDFPATASTASISARASPVSHKRRRSGAFACRPELDDDSSSCSAAEGGCTTSGESSGDESDASSSSFEQDVEAEEAAAAAKRRRRADLDGLKKSVRVMEAQVVDASAQLRDLAALVAQVVARRQQQRQLA